VSKNAEPSSASDLFSTDRPISTRAEDKLGRSQFAQAIARAIAAWQGRDSLVIGLYGGWGSGKSSVKNMIVEALGTKPNDARVIEFNPWQFANRNRLAESFFEQVGIALGRGTDRRWRRAAKQLERYAAGIKAGGQILLVAAKLAPLVILIIALLFFGISFWVSRVISLIWASVAIFAAWLAVLAATFFEQVARLLQTVAGEPKAVAELKEDLGRTLRALNRPVLVVLDDLDRLTPEELLEAFHSESQRRPPQHGLLAPI